jgi:hypothetical protein
MKKRIQITGIVLLVQTIVWLVFTIISMSQVDSGWEKADYVKWVANPDFFFIGNYINGTLLTVTATILFCFLYLYLKDKTTGAWIIGLVFVPMYALLNIVSYSIQISIVPQIATYEMQLNHVDGLAQHLIQADSHSIIGYLNGLAYALLAVPSIIFGSGLIKNNKPYTGRLLFANGISCIIGLTGYLMNNEILSLGVMAGGVIFLLALIFLIKEFK